MGFEAEMVVEWGVEQVKDQARDIIDYGSGA